MTTNKTTLSQKITLLLSLLAVLVTKLVPSPPGLPQSGFQVLGILMAAILLFLSHGTGWTSMAVIFLLMTVPGITAAQVTQASFGNSTVVFLMFCFMLAACLTESGVAKRIAICFLTNRLSRKSPWWTVVMYFAAVYVLNFFLSAATCIMILMPILMEIFKNAGLSREKHGVLTTMLLLCTVVIGQLSNGANPISHAVTSQGFSLYESYTGQPMDFFIYCTIGTVISLVGVLAVFLILLLVKRLDVSPFAALDFDALSSVHGSMSPRERWSLIIYGICVLFWLLPGLSMHICPEIYPYFSGINNCIPPLAALFVMNFVKVDGEKILDWKTAATSVNWPSFLFIASIMGLGSFMGQEELGISQWLSGGLSSAFAGISPLFFVLIMVLTVNVLTNFCSNSVALSVVYTIALPLCLNIYHDSLSPMLVSILITSGAQNGWATAPATPAAAVAYASGWGDSRSILKWGLFIMLVQIFICVFLGFALGNILL